MSKKRDRESLPPIDPEWHEKLEEAAPKGKPKKTSK